MAVNCGPECEWVFGEISVFPLIAGGTRISWNLSAQFSDPPPFEFQLQFGRTNNPLADDWENIGSAVYDTYYVDDPEKRMYGMQTRAYYRIVLTSGIASYASRPVGIFSTFAFHEHQLIRNIVRQQELRLKFKSGNEGYLLKRRVFGTACPNCTDPITDESRVPSCPVCYGTGIEGGYFAPYPCVYVEFTKKSTREHMSDYGTQNDGPVVACRMLNQPSVNSYDVWVDRSSDTRWFIHKIESEVEIRSVPIVLSPVELRMAPFSHIIYSLPIEGQHSA